MNTESIWEIIVIFCEELLFYIFIRTKLTASKTSVISKIAQFLFLTGYILIIYMHNLSNASTLLTILLSFCLDFLFIKLFFTVSFFYSLFLSIMYSFICIVAEYITLIIPQIFMDTSVEQMLVGGNLRIPISFNYIALIAILVFLFAHLFNKNIYLSLFQKISYTVLTVLGICISHYILILTLIFSQNAVLEDKVIHLILINMFFLLMLLSLLIYIYQLGNSKEQNIKYLKREKQYELEKQQYEILLNTTTSLREMKHDIKHHLTVIKSLTEQNKWEKLQEYVNSYFQELEKSNLLLATGNTAIDCIVSSKLLTAKQLNISIQYSIVAPETFPMDDISLSSVIGNLLDNAIEGSLRSMESVENFTPWIRFYIKPFQNMVLIHVENKFDGIVKRDANQQLVSLKFEADHGIGLNRVAELVSENNGMLTITTDQQIFSVHIILPQKEDTQYDY